MRNAHVAGTIMQTCLALTIGVLATLPFPTPAAGQSMHRAYISTMPAPVRLAGEDVFSITADAGGFTAEERTIIIEKNLNNALLGSKDRTPEAVEIVTINKLPVIRVGAKHVLTVDTNLAKMYNTPKEVLAAQWCTNLKNVLMDRTKVESYVAQLSGDFLYSPYSPPYRRAQWEQARKNTSSFEFRKDLPLNLLSSDSLEDDGFMALNKRDACGAEQLFRSSLQASPRNQRAHYGLGLSLMKQGKIGEAQPVLDVARSLDPDDAQVHLALGQCAESKGLDREAITRYREASLLQPENPEPVLFIADMREERNDIGKSVTELTAAMQNAPESEYIRLRRQDQLTWRLIRPY
ncbi:MAG: tetratricopeptide repeat protein [Candidatus Obscuribacterales bacterium]|nr:tetratricopeptide repeat protein [Candidatus Obscuribacterales bacterium]